MEAKVGDFVYVIYNGKCQEAEIVEKSDCFLNDSGEKERMWFCKFEADNVKMNISLPQSNIFQTKAECQKKLIAMRPLIQRNKHGKDWCAGYDTAMEELNTPMETITEDWRASVCPHCGHDFMDYEPCNDGYYKRAVSLERCPYCGQKLLWRE